MKNIILCGPPGVGKSTIGMKFAQRIQATFIDLDSVMESEFKKNHHQQMTCRQIYQSKGPHFFRELEKQSLDKVVKQSISNVILALGGGSLERNDIVDILKGFGVVVYLSETAEILYSRVIASGLPGYLDKDNPAKSFQDLLARRRKHYEEIADFTVDTNGKSIDEITEQLMQVTGV